MIIDCHCHAGKGDGLTGPWDTAAPLEKYMLRAAKAGITRTVLLAAFHSDYAAANREVARIVASRPDHFYGFAFVHPERDRGRVRAMVEEAVTRYGFCGIKVHRHDGHITREICEVAPTWSLSVMYDVMGEVSVIELLAQEYAGARLRKVCADRGTHCESSLFSAVLHLLKHDLGLWGYLVPSAKLNLDISLQNVS